MFDKALSILLLDFKLLENIGYEWLPELQVPRIETTTDDNRRWLIDTFDALIL
jgi:hypothetical protein